jgi:hypothetical protein
MSSLSIDQLRYAASARLFEAAVTLEGGKGLGVPVHLERRKSKPTIITTAEAVCALAPLRKRKDDTFNGLVEGLITLFTEGEEHNRHRGWFVLAMIAAKRDDEAWSVVLKILEKGQEEGGYWLDPENRKHEVYSSWIVTWALVAAVEYFQKKKPSEEEQFPTLRKVAGESVDYLLKVLTPVPGDATKIGAPFTTKLNTPDRFHERLPNPAMTAYVLSLLAQAARVLQRPELSERVVGGYQYLRSAANRGIWDSYREPYQPGSDEGDFEHFTTCWVARACWEGVRVFPDPRTGSGDPGLRHRREWLWILATALRALMTPLQAVNPLFKLPGAVRSEEEEQRSSDRGEQPASTPRTLKGLIYVDRGSPRDYSFAIADYLMLLNSISKAGVKNLPADDLLLRLITLADVDYLIHDVSELRTLSHTYADYQQLIAGQTELATKATMELEDKKRQLREVQQELTEAEQDVASKKDEGERLTQELDSIRARPDGTLPNLVRSTKKSLSVSVFTGYDLAFLVAGVFLGIFQPLLSLGLQHLFLQSKKWADLLASTLCLALLAPLVPTFVMEITRARQRGTISFLHFALPIALLPLLLGSAGIVFQALRGSKDFGDMLPIVAIPLGSGFGFLLAKAHKKHWNRIGTVTEKKQGENP